MVMNLNFYPYDTYINQLFQAGDDPPFLPVGTEVSAKYRGAFCEAKVKKIVRSVKCKVSFKILSFFFMIIDKGEWISWEKQGKSKV